MTDFAFALIGEMGGAFALDVSLAPSTRPSDNNNPAVLNNPTRTASRLDIGKLRLMPVELALENRLALSSVFMAVCVVGSRC